MFRSLYARLATTLFGLLSLLAVVYLGLTLWSTRVYLQAANQRLHRDLARSVVSEGLIDAGGEVEEGELKAVFHTLMVVNPSIEVYLLDSRGEILAYSAPRGKVQSQRVSLDPVERFLRDPEAIPVLGDDPRSPGDRKVFSAAPVAEGDGSVRGYLYMILAGEPYRSALELLRRSHVSRLTAGLGLGALLLVFAAGLLFFNVLTRRLRRLTREVTAFQSPSPEGASASHGGDEIDELAAAFRALQDRIREQLARLRAADAERRDLVSNISHDLRTPLSSLQGHLETVLLKEEELGREDRRHHLGAALQSSRRLGRLVSELFELAKLEAPRARLEVEPFPLPELAQDVAQKLRLELDRKGITVEMGVEDGIPFVRGDIGLVERALENLFRNAVEHSPAGGKVITRIRAAAGGGVEVRLSDQGPGIDPQDLPHLFERFYRGRRGAGHAGAGLGLAIARRIADLHGGTIRAENRAEGGATFSLRLPAQAASPSPDRPSP